MTQISTRPITARTVTALMLLLAHCLGGTAGAADPAADGRSLGGPYPFELMDHHRNTVSNQDFRGSYLLLYFGYTSCPDVCPAGLVIAAQAIRNLGALGERVQPLFISVDHQRDTPEVLAKYVASFHPRLIGLSGTKEQISKAARPYEVFYYVDMLNGRFTVDHTANTYLVGPDGKLLHIYPHGIQPAELTEGLRRFVRPAESS